MEFSVLIVNTCINKISKDIILVWCANKFTFPLPCRRTRLCRSCSRRYRSLPFCNRAYPFHSLWCSDSRLTAQEWAAVRSCLTWRHMHASSHNGIYLLSWVLFMLDFWQTIFDLLHIKSRTYAVEKVAYLFLKNHNQRNGSNTDKTIK